MGFAFVDDFRKVKSVILVRKGDFDFAIGCGDAPAGRRVGNDQPRIFAMFASAHRQGFARCDGRGGNEDRKKDEERAPHQAASFFSCFSASSMSEKPGRSWPGMLRRATSMHICGECI